MGTYTGKRGVVNGQSTVRNWSVTDSVAQTVWAASNTLCGMNRSPGTESWTGSFLQNGGIPTLRPGELFTFQGYTAPTSGVTGTDGIIYSGQARVSQITVNWSWDGNDVLIGHTVNFQGHGPLDIASGAALTDGTDPIENSVILSPGLFWELNGNTGAHVKLENVASITLTLSNSLQPFTNSSTTDFTVTPPRSWQQTQEGNFDWTLSASIQENDRIIPKNALISLQAFIDDTDFWRLDYGRVGEYSNINTDVEGATIISQDLNVGMVGTPGALTGEVRAPGAPTAMWP